MNTQPGPTASDGDADDGETETIDLDQFYGAFADLTAIDVIDGELVPRHRARR